MTSTVVSIQKENQSTFFNLFTIFHINEAPRSAAMVKKVYKQSQRGKNRKEKREALKKEVGIKSSFFFLFFILNFTEAFVLHTTRRSGLKPAASVVRLVEDVEKGLVGSLNRPGASPSPPQKC